MVSNIGGPLADRGAVRPVVGRDLPRADRQPVVRPVAGRDRRAGPYPRYGDGPRARHRHSRRRNVRGPHHREALMVFLRVVTGIRDHFEERVLEWCMAAAATYWG